MRPSRLFHFFQSEEKNPFGNGHYDRGLLGETRSPGDLERVTMDGMPMTQGATFASHPYIPFTAFSLCFCEDAVCFLLVSFDDSSPILGVLVVSYHEGSSHEDRRREVTGGGTALSLW